MVLLAKTFTFCLDPSALKDADVCLSKGRGRVKASGPHKLSAKGCLQQNGEINLQGTVQHHRREVDLFETQNLPDPGELGKWLALGCCAAHKRCQPDRFMEQRLDVLQNLVPI